MTSYIYFKRKLFWNSRLMPTCHTICILLISSTENFAFINTADLQVSSLNVFYAKKIDRGANSNVLLRILNGSNFGLNRN